MKLRSYILLFFLNCVIVFHCKAENKAFENFARHQSQLLNLAHWKKDVKTYGKLLGELKKKFDQLNANDQKNYADYLAEGYYNYCCTYSLLNDKNSAINYLHKAINAGYTDYNRIMEDTDLDNIRKAPAFVALLQPLREVGDYLYIIKKAGTYSLNDDRQFPAFVYQPANNANLVLLRKTLKLDSIAGSGNEVSKVLNLMYWMHNLVPHDGKRENPVNKNALDMINVCKKDKRGLNCSGLATVLNECYLSLGFKSRFVTCLPKDSLRIDNDCHVINTVYIDSLKKWIWVDPTFSAYVMDENGQLLGINEVRERIIDGRPLILNPDANWNHKVSETAGQYLYNYMAKNLYRFECSVNSEYDTETATPGKVITYVRLLPLNYFEQKPDILVTVNSNKVSYIAYNTNNQALFWAAPPNK